MSPVTVAGTLTQVLAEVLAGTRVLPARAPGRARHFRHVRLDAVDAIGRADLRHARGGARDLRRGPARAPHEHAVPHRRLAVRLENPGRAGGLRERADAAADDVRGHEFRAARRRLDGGRPLRFVREIRDGFRPARRDASLAKGIDLSENGQAMEAFHAGRARRPFPRLPAYPGQFRDRRSIAPTSPTTIPSSNGRRRDRRTPRTRANAIWKKMLAEYEPPPIDPGDRRGVAGFHRQAQKASMPDMNY